MSTLARQADFVEPNQSCKSIFMTFMNTMTRADCANAEKACVHRPLHKELYRTLQNRIASHEEGRAKQSDKRLRMGNDAGHHGAEIQKIRIKGGGNICSSVGFGLGRHRHPSTYVYGPCWEISKPVR